MVEVNDRLKVRPSRREAILDVARDVFLRDGYAAASMSAIAARAGGSKGTLYNYFPSKEELFTAVVHAQCTQVHTALYDFDEVGEDIASKLRVFAERYVRAMVSDEVLALHRLVVAESCRFPEIGRTLYEAGPRPGHAMLTAYVRDAMAAGKLRDADPACAAGQFTDLCLSGLYRMRLWNVAPPPEASEIRSNVEAALATFLAAYGVQAQATA